jgi:hypothetical protein
MKSKKVKIEEWSIFVSESIMDVIHHGGRTITEFYIPENNIAINIDGEKLAANVFRVNRSDRYDRKGVNHFNQPPPEKIGEHFVDKKFVDFLERYLNIKESLFTECTKAIGAMK